MPKDIYEFKSIDDAIDVLAQFGDSFKFPIKKLSEPQIVKKSVESNIFRAFHNCSTRPSEIYRQWASENFEQIVLDFKKVNSQIDQYKFIFKYGDSLLNSWAQETLESNSYLQYGPALKIINLLIKMLQESVIYRQPEKIKFQQVPLDSFSLRPIRKIINELTDLNYKIAIPATASMSFINTQQLYSIIMEAIFKLCKLSKISPIVYDYWCWDDKH